MSILGESFAFRLTVAIISIFAGITAVLGIFYFNKVRQNPISDVSSTTATVMIVLNAILLILAFAILIWAFVSLFWTYYPAVVTTPVTSVELQPVQSVQVPVQVQGSGVYTTTSPVYSTQKRVIVSGNGNGNGNVRYVQQPQYVQPQYVQQPVQYVQ